jgi:hypothetical protein
MMKQLRVSGDTLLWLIRDDPLPTFPPPRVIGV